MASSSPSIATTAIFYSFSTKPSPSSIFLAKSYSFPLQNHPFPKITYHSLLNTRSHHSTTHLNAIERSQFDGTSPLLLQEEEDIGVEESVEVLKNAAKTRRVPAAEVLSALAVIKKAKIDPSAFLDTLGGTESPGRTWMLIFTAKGRLEGGSYFPVTAVQRFDATAKRIENGLYLGPIGCLTFEGRLSWKNRILAFIFECVRIKIGPFGPLKINLGKGEEREPTTKDPFFIWFYVDEEIAVAQGRGGGTAFWCRCRRVT
ncbi:uncharacterized protein LOC131235208 [Magnolia sinica]|uniref:uncharacterized protein LOC131235208 n=1 Tax=Magnolia sinica TaxID=86752 RepID=UPI0026595E95|nr:uncharacterized protein LOC131235208 [Magnolia sinica]